MLANCPISKVMSLNPITIAPRAHLVDAANLMLKHHISTLPVIECDKLVGIITESDIFRAFVEMYRKG
jgi:acetoin utilization protein AcuB